jgi:ACT domain-containing protein
VRISLNKANRLLKQLKEQSKNVKLPSSRVSKSFPYVTDTQKIVDVLTVEVQKETAALVEFGELYTDIADLTRSKKLANLQSGVAEILDRIELSRKMLAHYRQQVQNFDNDMYARYGESVTLENIVDLATHVEKQREIPEANRRSQHMVVGLQAITKAQVEVQATVLQRDINELEDKLLELNATTFIDIELTATSKRLLGIAETSE